MFQTEPFAFTIIGKRCLKFLKAKLKGNYIFDESIWLSWKSTLAEPRLKKFQLAKRLEVYVQN